ncbi:MAG: hypothetical protein ABI619_13600, partial [Betaproteobacteria bacterium]
MAAQFIPATEDSSRLGNGNDSESQFFRRVAAQGHYPKPDDNKQGIYVLTAGGKLRASNNETARPKVVATLLRNALDKWATLSTDERTGKGESQPIRSGRSSYPKDGLVLRCNYRDLPRDSKHDLAEKWNEDFAWFTKDEARQFLPANPVAGQTHNLPASLAQRFASCHLVDVVRGSTRLYKPNEVKKAQLSLRVTTIQRNVISLAISGETRTAAEGVWTVNGHGVKPTQQKRGYEATLLGTATYDLNQQKFISFELLAVGHRWGGTEFNVRFDDLDRNPMGVLFTLAGRNPMEIMPPSLI